MVNNQSLKKVGLFLRGRGAGISKKGWSYESLDFPYDILKVVSSFAPVNSRRGGCLWDFCPGSLHWWDR